MCSREGQPIGWRVAEQDGSGGQEGRRGKGRRTEINGETSLKGSDKCWTALEGGSGGRTALEGKLCCRGHKLSDGKNFNHPRF